MNRTNIEWCDYTWNPIKGCRNGCSYCWAKRMNDRFKFIPDFEKPVFFPSALREPGSLKTPSKIAVCLMGDIFSPGVQDDWINRVLYTCRTSNHIFMLLTKFPVRYYEFDIPSNCWIGVSAADYRDAHRINVLSSICCKYAKFVSIEPLLGSMEGVDLSNMDYVFVGAQTGPGAIAPEREWIQSIKHPNILWKENIKKYLPIQAGGTGAK